MSLNSNSQITPTLVFVGFLSVIPSGLLFQSRLWVICSCGIPFFLCIFSVWVRGRLISPSLVFHTVRKHFSPLIQIKLHLGDARRERSPCMRRQHRWCVIVWSSERTSQVCWMCPKVWTGRPVSVVNLPCDTHNALQSSHLSDSFLLVIWLHQQFDGKQCIIDWAFSSSLDVEPVFSLTILQSCLGFPPRVSLLWRLT